MHAQRPLFPILALLSMWLLLSGANTGRGSVARIANANPAWHRPNSGVQNLTVDLCGNYTGWLTGQSILPWAFLRPECLVTEINSRWVCGGVLPF